MNKWQTLGIWGGMITLWGGAIAPLQAQAPQQWQIEQQIHPDRQPTTFVLQGYTDDERTHITRILIYDGAPHPHHWQQTIEGIEAWSHDLLEVGFVVEDLNFDGYADLRLQEFLPASPNVPYLYWLYNPQTQQFEFNEALRVITLPDVDPLTQRIRSFTRVNAAVYEVSDYQFIASELTLVRQEITTFTPEQRHVIIKERQGGQLIVVEDFVEPLEKP